MLTGKSPFYHKNVDKILENILFKDICLSDVSSSRARSLISRLLERDPDKRIGAKEGASEIMKDKFFKDIDWHALSKKMIKVPYRPKIVEETSVKYFSQEFVDEEAQDSLVDSRLTLKQKTDNHFEEFTYGKENVLNMDPEEQNRSKSYENSIVWEMDTAKEDLSEF